MVGSSGRQPCAATIVTPALSADGRTVAFTGDGGIHLWDVDARQLLRINPTHLGAVLCQAFAPGGHVLASGGHDGTVRLWDVRSGRPLESTIPRPATDGPVGPDSLELPASAGYADGLAVSPDGRSIAAGGFSGWIQVWDARTGEVRLRLPKSPGPVRDLLFSRDGDTLAAAIDSETSSVFIRLFNAVGGRHRLDLADTSGPFRPPWSIAMTPDSRLVAAGMGVLGEPGRIVIWDARSGAVRSVLRGHSDFVRGVVDLSGRPDPRFGRRPGRTALGDRIRLAIGDPRGP